MLQLGYAAAANTLHQPAFAYDQLYRHPQYAYAVEMHWAVSSEQERTDSTGGGHGGDMHQAEPQDFAVSRASLVGAPINSRTLHTTCCTTCSPSRCAPIWIVALFVRAQVTRSRPVHRRRRRALANRNGHPVRLAFHCGAV
jgi:hypothetical protein